MRRGSLVVALAAVVCGAGLVGCGGGGGGGGYQLVTRGGLGGNDGGTGGAGGYVEVDMDYGTGGNIEFVSTGVANAVYRPSTFTPYLGTNPYSVTRSMVVTVAAFGQEPAAGVLYQSGSSLYVSDGDINLGDEFPVTGLSVNGGVTLTFGVEGAGTTSFNLDNDFVSHGTVTTADDSASARGSLTIYCLSFLNRGTIALHGRVAGQTGGNLSVNGSDHGCFIGSGSITTYGAAAEDANGGAGGSVYLFGDDFCENNGPILTYGGAATGASGSGGAGGNVELETDLGDTRNAGRIDTRGGNGIDGGGNGGYFKHYIDYSGDCVNRGAVVTRGGDTENGNGGDGGYVQYDTWQGGIRHNAGVDARGGSATGESANGGTGGYFYLGSWSGSSYEPTPGDYTPVKDTEVSGTINLAGGSALAQGTGSGGDGGYIDCELEGDYWPRGQRIRFLGYGLVDTRGGDGNYGGDGGYVDCWQEYSYDEDNYFGPGGFRLDGVSIDTRGGNCVTDGISTYASGGYGGYVTFDMTTYPYANAGTTPFDLPKFFMRGSITTSGGANLGYDAEYENYGGDVWIYAKQGVEVRGNITARGGDDRGTDAGCGGYGGDVDLLADFGNVIVGGTVDQSGGDGFDVGGSAGGYDYATAATSQGSVAVGAVVADGGDSDLDAGEGGAGGYIWLFSPQGPQGVSYGRLSAKGGAGITPGDDGEIFAGGHMVAP